MRNVGLIVRRELAAYARTPSGWIIAGVVLLLEGLIFNAYAVGDQPRESTQVLLRFLEGAGSVTIIMGVLFSMRLIAEERATGTDVLLFTSPIREGEIVVGKYLASLAFISLAVLASLYLPALIFMGGKVSWGHIASGYLGMLLLGAGTLALGTFASSLVPHPFLAVIVTAAFAGMLELSWWVAQIMEGGGLKDVLEYAAPYYKHFQPLRRGILQLSDLVFFGALIYFSLLAATRVLKARRWR